MTIPRTPIETEPLDLWREHRGENMAQVGHETLRAAFIEAGVKLGAHDARIAAWLGNTWELSTVVTIASWVVRAFEAGRAAAPDQPTPDHVTLDLSDERAYFVLTDALEEWAHRQRGDAENELKDDPEHTTAALRLKWAETADKLLNRIEASDKPAAAGPDQPRTRSALDFHPEKTRIGDFPFPVGSTVRGSMGSLYVVTDHDGFAFIACCTRHEKEDSASGWYPAERGQLLAEFELVSDQPLTDCGRD